MNIGKTGSPRQERSEEDHLKRRSPCELKSLKKGAELSNIKINTRQLRRRVQYTHGPNACVLQAEHAEDSRKQSDLVLVGDSWLSLVGRVCLLGLLDLVFGIELLQGNRCY